MTEPMPIDARAVEHLLTLNNEHAEELSPLDRNEFARLMGEAFLACSIDVDAFVFAFDATADYGSPNFLWFRERYPRFVYVDRVVVSAAARGRGYARALYDAVFAAARAAGHERVVCEVNVRPPNPASDAFHAKLGFREVGNAEIHRGAKHVRYLECPFPQLP